MSLDLADIKDELDDVKDTVKEIAQTKQNRISFSVVASLMIFMIGQAGAAIWWAGTTTATLSSLVKIIENNTMDRYPAARASADFELRDQRIDFIQDQIDNSLNDFLRVKERLDRHIEEARDINPKK